MLSKGWEKLCTSDITRLTLGRIAIRFDDAWISAVTTLWDLVWIYFPSCLDFLLFRVHITSFLSSIVSPSYPSAAWFCRSLCTASRKKRETKNIKKKEKLKMRAAWRLPQFHLIYIHFDSKSTLDEIQHRGGLYIFYAAARWDSNDLASERRTSLFLWIQSTVDAVAPSVDIIFSISKTVSIKARRWNSWPKYYFRLLSYLNSLRLDYLMPPTWLELLRKTERMAESWAPRELAQIVRLVHLRHKKKTNTDGKKGKRIEHYLVLYCW